MADTTETRTSVLLRDFPEIGTPLAPGAGLFRVYARTDNSLYFRAGASGAETALGGAALFAAPTIFLGTVAGAGVAVTALRSDATIVAFDATLPAAIGAAAVGVVALAARRDHVHAGDHTALTTIGTNTHAQIDTHLAATGTAVHGLGTMSTQNANAIAITGGTLAGITAFTFTASVTSITALATPSAYVATTGTLFASTVSGATLMGFGTTADVTLKNRAGTDVLVVTANTLNVTMAGALAITGALSGVTTVAQSGKTTTYNNVATAGWGIPAIQGLDNRTGLTAADGAATTLYTTTAANQLFRVSVDIFATAAVTGTAIYTITWTENATTQTMAVNCTVINSHGAGTMSNLIRPDNGTAITVQLTGTFTGTFTVVGLVEQIA